MDGELKIGEEVTINGIVDGMPFENQKDFITDMCYGKASTNNGEYDGMLYKMRYANWWVPYNNLTKQKDGKRIFNRLDPYGEENWEL